ncbi:type II CAAX endopeptidase family protein [Alkalihalobacillus sp. LMS39]|uniref:CPBP family intramembrane glutamic endopeptidase n=1 Tax=Alkalihalobacillus sp. LMS39 TaxID=2924032 RepID=UPI001FB26936|nr:type II CAAX endopeptidase family protein [Alkalihalobacillus sp. LMS39]UOE95171.1 CPBP family intramembrane metalloprotease [Alkalihalobacillus sp. LMS39]
MSNSSNFKQISIWAVTFKILLLVALIIVAMFSTYFVFDFDKTIAGNIFTIITYLGMIYIVLNTFKTKGIKQKFVIGQISFRNEKWIKYIAIQLFLSFFSLVSIFALLYLFTGMYEDLIITSSTEVQDVPVTGALLTLFSFVILAPIAEELLFRGFLFNRLGETIGLGKAMFLSSFIFSLLHFNQGFIGHFLLGIFACIIYVKTQKLLLPIMMHGLNNLIAYGPTVMDSIFNQPTEFDMEQLLQELQLMVSVGAVLFIILTPIIIFMFYKIYPKDVKSTPYESNKLKSI